MPVRGIRGAINLKRNSKEEIRNATQRLLRALVSANDLELDQIAAAFFTATPDLTADFPAYAARDPALAREVIASDKKVDAFYNSIFRNLVSHMVENPATISSAAQLLFVARNIERIGDHATNVAEMVYFAATGSYPLDDDS